jgi:hypothetical protein
VVGATVEFERWGKTSEPGSRFLRRDARWRASRSKNPTGGSHCWEIIAAGDCEFGVFCLTLCFWAFVYRWDLHLRCELAFSVLLGTSGDSVTLCAASSPKCVYR